VGTTHPVAWSLVAGLDPLLTVRLPLPGPALRPNGGHGHWARVSRARKKYRADAGLLALAEARERSFRECLSRAIVGVVWCSPNARRCDGDNALASLKPGFDGIVDAKIISDDRAIIHLPVAFVVASRPAEQGVDIVVYRHP